MHVVNTNNTKPTKRIICKYPASNALPTKADPSNNKNAKNPDQFPSFKLFVGIGNYPALTQSMKFDCPKNQG